MADKRKLVFHVSASLATAGVVAAVAVGCGPEIATNPAPQNNENIITNPAPQDLGDGGDVGDAGSDVDDAGDSGFFCNPVCSDLGSPDAGDLGEDTGDIGSSDVGDMASDAEGG